MRPTSFLVVSAAFCSVCYLSEAAPPSSDYKLVFSDEFSGATLDKTKWGFGFGWGTNSGAFSEYNREQNLTFDSGQAVFKSEYADGKYYSAAINTRSKMIQKYGYWEVRSRVSHHVAGVLPAFWQKLQNDSWPPEVDIYEFFGTQSKQAMTIHYSDGGHKQSGTSVSIENTNAFHVYGLEYTKDFIRWWTDGKMVREITPSSHGKFFSQWAADNVYTMINTHMTDKYSWLGSVDKSRLPVRVWVDYFRMYSKGGGTPAAAPLKSMHVEKVPTTNQIVIGNSASVGAGIDISGRITRWRNSGLNSIKLVPRK